MISVVHNGELVYISKMEDFRDVMEPSVYEGLAFALKIGLNNEDWKEKYDNLSLEYDELAEELESTENELESSNLDYADLKYDFCNMKTRLGDLLVEHERKYISTDELLISLEKLAEEFPKT